MATLAQDKELEFQGEATKSSPYTIEHWDPENETFWQTTGKKVARRNLIFSIFVEFLGFALHDLQGAGGALPDAGPQTIAQIV